MIKIRWIASVIAVAALLIAAAGTTAMAQVTTGSIVGQVVSESGEPLSDVQIQVRSTETGRTAGASTRSDGRFAVLGLEVGGGYEVTARRIGYAPVTQEFVRVALGAASALTFTLRTQAVQVEGITISSSQQSQLISPDRQGTSTTFSDTLLRRLPTLNRNFTDFVSLTPQIGGSGPGLSGGGTNNRFNNIQIDGATESDLFGLGSTGQPGGQAGGKSIGIESVKEYQVLLAPYDTRQGNFSGALINAVTKSGQNNFFGSAYAFGRNQSLTRSQDYINDFEQTQYGFSLGGPIIRDRLLFFVNPEFQDRRIPAGGPLLGTPGLNLTEAQVTEFTSQLAARGMDNFGNTGPVTNENPLRNVFARLDFILPGSNTLVLRHNYGGAEDDNFGRSLTSFPLSNAGYFFRSQKNSTVAQLRSNFDNGAYNEVILNYTTIRDRRTPSVVGQPQVDLFQPGFAALRAGSERFSQGNELDQDMFEFTNNYTLPLGNNHRVTVGTQNQLYKVRNLFAQSIFGAYVFGTADSLAQGIPRQYIVGVPVTGDGAVRFSSLNWSVYAQDDWTISNNFNITYGLRVEAPTFRTRPPFNPVIAEAPFNRRTDEVPSNNIQFSPRFGFNWDVTGDAVNQIRGGVGVFVGRPAYVWLSNAFQNSGGVSGVALLTCNANQQGTPAFTQANVSNPPTQCPNGTTASAGSEVNLLSRDLNFPQNLRSNLAYDRRIFGNYVVSLEGIYTRGLNNFFYINRALGDNPVGQDPDGRQLYGTVLNQPQLRAPGRTVVLDVENQSEDYAYNLTAGLSRNFVNNFGGSIFYTYSQAKDVQNLTSSTAFSNYRFGRAYSGRQDDRNLTTSIFEQPHRIIANASYTLPWRTTVTAIYRGESGQAFNYVSSADLNADGQTLNDPVYIPTGPNDPRAPIFQQFTVGSGANAVTFTPAEQSAAFFEFLDGQACFRDQRGSIQERNSCRAPFVNQFDLALEQGLPTFRGQSLTLRLDIINFGNLLNSEWGQIRSQGFGGQTLYTQVGSTGGTDLRNATTLPLVRFNPNTEAFNANNIGSNYQMQVSLRYAF